MINKFMLKQGAEENGKVVYIKLTHYVDEDLIKTIVNKYAEEGLDRIVEKLDLNLSGIEDMSDIDEINTFWY